MFAENDLLGKGKVYNTLFRKLSTDNPRWWSTDPLASLQPGLTPYSLMGGNPINRIDPLGLKDKGKSTDNRITPINPGGGGGGDSGAEFGTSSSSSTADIGPVGPPPNSEQNSGFMNGYGDGISEAFNKQIEYVSNTSTEDMVQDYSEGIISGLAATGKYFRHVWEDESLNTEESRRLLFHLIQYYYLDDYEQGYIVGQMSLGILEIAVLRQTIKTLRSRKNGNVTDKKIVEKTEIKPYSNPKSRPSYKAGQVDDVWENAMDSDGLVRDPYTDEIITWDKSKNRIGQWDMGHIEGQKYSNKHKEYMDGKISKKEFLDWYQNAENYQPQSINSNRSRKYD